MIHVLCRKKNILTLQKEARTRRVQLARIIKFADGTNTLVQLVVTSCFYATNSLQLLVTELSTLCSLFLVSLVEKRPQSSSCTRLNLNILRVRLFKENDCKQMMNGGEQ